MAIDDLSLSKIYAQQSKALRTGLMAQLYGISPFYAPGNDSGNRGNLLISDFLGAFKRYAGNQQTAYDSGSIQSSSTNTSNQWERVVDRAINRALGKSPGQGGNNFVNALNAAFPQNGYGQAAIIVIANNTNNLGSNELLTEVSTEQAILYRQVNTNMADALKVLAEIQYFSPKVDKESVEALRELIRGRILFLVEEFRRADEPRANLVKFYLYSLDEYTTEFGRKASLNNPNLGVTIEDEEQTTKYRLLKSYITNLSQAWTTYYKRERSELGNSLSIRVDRARVLLPIVAQANLDFSNSLESVGLSENERRSRASLFSAIDIPPILPQNQVQSPSSSRRSSSSESNTSLMLRSNQVQSQSSGSFSSQSLPILDPAYIASWLPKLTVSDLIDWLDKYANIEAPSALDSTYGIDFVTDQADRLFWTIAPVVAHIKFIPTNPSGSSTLKQILSNERVTWALDNILSQLNALADQAA
ncbi:hypothetical protein [Nostoc sp. GT001]|uniref:hypothetical protein n=1 Tax=Nostoc sp. GT001 TaxID=3056647 RepID=UPI0025AA33B9|nr:hypothetical protein [Nostoc sp. GT001]MDM9580114.1 hypothetical protein [Nostoc sp. GT001]